MPTVMPDMRRRQGDGEGRAAATLSRPQHATRSRSRAEASFSRTLFGRFLFASSPLIEDPSAPVILPRRSKVFRPPVSINPKLRPAPRQLELLLNQGENYNADRENR